MVVTGWQGLPWWLPCRALDDGDMQKPCACKRAKACKSVRCPRGGAPCGPARQGGRRVGHHGSEAPSKPVRPDGHPEPDYLFLRKPQHETHLSALQDAPR